VGAQERAPRRSAPLRRGLKAVFEQHLAHRGRGGDDAETLQFADDPLVAPVPVLVGETEDQFAN
jgi:hypothetical protein